MKRFLSLFVAIISCFAVFTFTACKEEKTGFTFYTPDGAPALSIAQFIKDKENFGTGKDFSYNVVPANEINNAILKEGADFVIMPVNSATKLYKENGKEDYKMIAVITHGNFYVMSKENLEGLEGLVGKMIFVPQSGRVPDLTLQASLKAKNIPYETGDTAKEGVVVLNYAYTEPSDIVKLMIKGEVQIGLIPEPAATNLSAKGFNYAIDLQEAYDAENKSYPQAVLMAKSSIVKNYPEVITAMANAFAGNVRATEKDPVTAVKTIKEIFENSSLADNLKTSAVYGCNIYWQGASDAKDQVNAYINRIREINSDFANVVDEGFYL